MSRNPVACLALALLAVALQAAIVAAQPRCNDSPRDAAVVAGVGRIHVDVAGDEPCLATWLQRALEIALERLEPVARERRLPCSSLCWLDRPTSAIARVGHRGDLIWPTPPGVAERIADGWVIFVVMAPDLMEGWLWIGLGPPDAAGSRPVEVIDG